VLLILDKIYNRVLDISKAYYSYIFSKVIEYNIVIVTILEASLSPIIDTINKLIYTFKYI
jgi:hypothetical protein